MAEVLRQGRKEPTLIHEGPVPESPEDTTPIVGMAVGEGPARLIVEAVNGDRGNLRPNHRWRLGRRCDQTVYYAWDGDTDLPAMLWAWFADPAWARRVVDALNGEENSGV